MLKRIWFLALLAPTVLTSQNAPRSRPGPETPLPAYDRMAAYVAHHAFAGGATLTYDGIIKGDRWVMNRQPTPFWPANERHRTIITPVPNGMRYIEEHSVDGGPWKVTEDYRYRKLR
jgi:hypothetical protein